MGSSASRKKIIELSPTKILHVASGLVLFQTFVIKEPDDGSDEPKRVIPSLYGILP
jgi:hypothetical protein